MCYKMVSRVISVVAIIFLVQLSPHWTGAMNTGFTYIWTTLRYVGVDGKAGARTRLFRILKTFHFQISDLSFFFFKLISEVTVLLVLLHQLLYSLENCESLNT